VAMREGSAANGLFIVLQGKLHVQPSRIEIQSLQRLRSHDETASEQKMQEKLGTEIGPSMVFGETSLLLGLPRMRTAITLESTELLLVTDAQLKQAVGSKPAEDVRQQLKSQFSAMALQHVPFFMSLPELTRRQISRLLGIEYYPKGDTICKQGDPGDPMFIVLFGNVEVWRQKKARAPREKIAAYTGMSDYPWFGEVSQWVNDHGRAGDVITTDDTLMLTLHRARVNEFVLLAPGFKALSMSAASAFTIRSMRVKNTHDDDQPLAKKYRKPLRFAVEWTRMVTKLLGASMGSLVAVQVQEIRKRQENSMGWINDTIAAATNATDVHAEEDEEAQVKLVNALEEQRRKLLERAHERHFGDTRTLAEVAQIGKLWRADWDLARSVRTELLRKPEFAQELAAARENVAYKPDRLPESFPELVASR